MTKAEQRRAAKAWAWKAAADTLLSALDAGWEMSLLEQQAIEQVILHLQQMGNIRPRRSAEKERKFKATMLDYCKKMAAASKVMSEPRE